MIEEKVDMRYEDRESEKGATCVFTSHGKEYRLRYEFILTLAQLYDVPDDVREYILFWAKMLNDPD